MLLYQFVCGDASQRFKHRIQAVDRRRARVVGQRANDGQKHLSVRRREKQRRQPRIARAGKALIVKPVVTPLHVEIVNAGQRADRRRRAKIKPLFPAANEHVDVGDAGKTSQRIRHGLPHGKKRLRLQRAVSRGQVHRRNAVGDGQRGGFALAVHRPRCVRSPQLCAVQQRRQRRLCQTFAVSHRHFGRNGHKPIPVRRQQIERRHLRFRRESVLRRNIRPRLDRPAGKILHRPFAHHALAAAQQRQRQRKQQRK